MLTTRQAIEAGFEFEAVDGHRGFWSFTFGDGYKLAMEPLIFGQVLVALYQHGELVTEKVPFEPYGEGMPPDLTSALIRAALADE